MIKIPSDLFIFEMANSHQGDLQHGINIIKEIGKIARKYNINAAVKLQYRNLDSFIHPSFADRTDVDHIPRFMNTRMDIQSFNTLIQQVREEGMITMSTPFDEDSVSLCLDQGLDIIKVASCSAKDWPLLEEVAKAKKPVIVSTGGLLLSDIDKLFNFFTHRNCIFAMLHCVAVYPAPYELLQMDFIDKLKKRYRGISIGYSGHEDPNDILIPTIAVAKGAEILERHVGLPSETIALNSYSMDPQQAEKWVESVLLAKRICRMKGDKKHVGQAELDSLRSLMRGVYVKGAVSKGEEITQDNIYFAMPCQENQMTSGEFYNGLIATRNYAVNEPVIELRASTGYTNMRSVIHDAKGMLYEAGIVLGNNYQVELSHHKGMSHFRQIGAIIVNLINREYCKKLMIVLPGQDHPMHAHKIKEETFQVLYGELDLIVDGEEYHLFPGDIKTILRDQMHAFSSKTGAIFEEVSTTHVKNDSYYEDETIAKLDILERKTILEQW